MEKVVKEVIPEKYLDEGKIYHLLLSEKFVEGGPKVWYFEKGQPIQTWILLCHMLLNVLLNKSAMNWYTFNQESLYIFKKASVISTGIFLPQYIPRLVEACQRIGTNSREGKKSGLDITPE